LPAEHYDKILYPLQNEVIALFRDAPFYLTGGTALSRGYFQHRYSDDLDYFVNDHPDFNRLVERQIAKLGTVFKDIHIALRGDNFVRLFVSPERMKIEMINDVPAHIGERVGHPVLGVIYVLLKDGLSIKKALVDADSKAAGISPLLVAKILAEFDYSLLDTEIKWITPVPARAILDFLTDVAQKIVKGEV
jgi:hypothetical protein